MDAEIEDLQARLAFQEDAIDGLNLTVSRQQLEIVELNRQLAQVIELLRELKPALVGDAADEPLPPHY